MMLWNGRCPCCPSDPCRNPNLQIWPGQKGQPASCHKESSKAKSCHKQQQQHAEHLQHCMVKASPTVLAILRACRHLHQHLTTPNITSQVPPPSFVANGGCKQQSTGCHKCNCSTAAMYLLPCHYMQPPSHSHTLTLSLTCLPMSTASLRASSVR